MSLYDYFGRAMVSGFVVGLLLALLGMGWGAVVSVVKGLCGASGPIPGPDDD